MYALQTGLEHKTNLFDNIIFITTIMTENIMFKVKDKYYSGSFVARLKRCNLR